MEKLKNTFLEGPILPSLLQFALPVLFALILQALYGAVDLWAVGKFATTADISAVATGSQTIQIITGIVTGLAMGTTVLLGQKIGQEDHNGAAQVIGTSIKIFTILGIALSVMMIFLAKPIALAMNAPIESFFKTIRYIQICGGGSLCIVAYNLLSAIFRGIGDSKSPLLFVSIACVANIVGDIFLIDMLNLGAAGAAISTVVAQAISVVLSLVLIAKKGLPFSFSKTHLRFHKKTATGVLKLGLPIALQDMCNEISYLIIIGFVNVLGVSASAGVGIAEKLVIFVLLIPMSYMQSISAFVAQNVGAAQYERARKALYTGMGTAAILGGIMAYISFFHGDVLSMIFLKDASAADAGAVIQSSVEFLKATSIECFILSIAYCLTGYFNGFGKTTFVMIQGLCAIFLVKIPYAWLASQQVHPQLFQIGLSMAFAAIFTLITCLIYFFLFTKKPGKNKTLDG
ncbi:MAG: MATE family efflux transporter [Erysipelotrichaceae bacterium]|nr:MATE family efflux transporter [Erysipelotrichaceae bacterium]